MIALILALALRSAPPPSAAPRAPDAPEAVDAARPDDAALRALVDAMRSEFMRLDRETGDPGADARRRLREIAILLAELDAPIEARTTAIRLARARESIDGWITKALRTDVAPGERRRAEWTRLLLERFAGASLERLQRVGSRRGGELDLALAETLAPLLEAVAAAEEVLPQSHWPARSIDGAAAPPASPSTVEVPGDWSAPLRESLEAWRRGESQPSPSVVAVTIASIDRLVRIEWLAPARRPAIEAWIVGVLADRNADAPSLIARAADLVDAANGAAGASDPDSSREILALVEGWLPPATSPESPALDEASRLVATLAEVRRRSRGGVDASLRPIRETLRQRLATEEVLAARRLATRVPGDPLAEERELAASLAAMRPLRADLARIDAASAWLDRIRVDSPRLANAAGRRLRRLAADLNTTEARIAAARSIDRLLRESPLAPMPHEATLLDGRRPAPRELSPVRGEVAATLVKQRWAWLEAWSADRDAEADPIWRSVAALRAILDVAFALPVVAAEEEVPLARRVARWAAWSVDPSVIAAAVSALGPRVRLALHAWLRGELDAVARHLEGWRREAPLALAAIEIDAVLGPALAPLADGVRGAVEAAAIGPARDAFLAESRALLARISSGLLELETSRGAAATADVERIARQVDEDLALLLAALRESRPREPVDPE